MAQKAKNRTSGNPGSQPPGKRENADRDNRAFRPDDTANEATVDRLEVTTGGSDQPRIVSGKLARETAALDASTEEEVDALRLNLEPDSRGRDTRDGTGRIVDELAANQIVQMTEAGPELQNKGVASVSPGRDNTSGILRRHHPDTKGPRAQYLVESNLDEPRDETRTERKEDDGTAA
jgi:hypothetical protein